MFVSDMMRSFLEDFVVLERRHVPDGEGGNVVRWEDGMRFSAVQKHASTILAQQAEAEGKASTFTLLIPKNMTLDYPDVVKRLRDGETFQITTDSGDLKTPDTSSLDMRAVRARKWRLPE